MLKLVNVSKFYYSKGIVSSGISKVNLELNLGEFVAITGESGSGKSTLLNVISGLDSYEEGEMYINGSETSHYTEKDFEDYRRKYISNIFQSFNLVNSYTVYQNVELVLLLNGYKKKDVKKKILNIIDEVGLTKFKNTKVSKLSGGQKQRVAIARAMVKDTPIIVADEPTGNLDSKSAIEVVEILKKVAKNKLVIVVTHNIEQIENLATKIIKMHDGRIVEINEIKKVNLDYLYDEETNDNKKKINNKNVGKTIISSKEDKSNGKNEKLDADNENDSFEKLRQTKSKSISFWNKYRLGIRNTFNIPAKFILLLIVFFFVASAIIGTYGGFKLSDNNQANLYGSSIVVTDISKERIIVNKNDRTPFDDDLYKKIENLEYVDYFVKDDIFLDSQVLVTKKGASEQEFMTTQISGTAVNISSFNEKLECGEMPKTDDEVIVEVPSKDYYVLSNKDSYINKKFSIVKSNTDGSNGDDELTEITIVGIAVSNKSSITDLPKMYFSDKIMNLLRIDMNKNYSTFKTFMNNKYTSYDVKPNKNVPSGKAIIDDDLKYQFKDYKAVDQPIKIEVSNIYYTQELNVTICNTYTKSNYKRLIGNDKYNANRNCIFINDDDYNSLYNKPSYQISVFVKHSQKLDEDVSKTMDELKGLGLNPKKASDYKISDFEVYGKIMNIVKTIVTILLVIALFFISYVIIKIILKSRNVYFTTLRMLGARMKDVKRILDIELFLNSSLAYLLLMILVYLIKSKIIDAPGLYSILEFTGIKAYVIVYFVVIIMARLVSNRFSNKLFKKSAIKTYNEEF